MDNAIYSFNQMTGEFINEAPADESPLEPGVILLPAFATTIKPPTIASCEVAVFAEGQWHIKADWRGVPLFSKVDGSSVSISEIGVTPIDVDATDKPMPSVTHSWKDGAWRLDPDKVAAHLKKAKADAIDRINVACEQSIAVIQAGYPASEVLSWPKQEAEARSYVADPDAATPLLDALAEARGIDKAELARRVILKADTFAQYSGATLGKRQALEDALNALPANATVEQIAAIAW